MVLGWVDFWVWVNFFSFYSKGHNFLVNEQCKVEFHIGGYKDKVLCDIIPMDVSHILLGKAWKYNRKVIHDGRRNTYTLEKNGYKLVLLHFQDEGAKE